MGTLKTSDAAVFCIICRDLVAHAGSRARRALQYFRNLDCAAQLGRDNILADVVILNNALK